MKYYYIDDGRQPDKQTQARSGERWERLPTVVIMAWTSASRLDGNGDGHK